MSECRKGTKKSSRRFILSDKKKKKMVAINMVNIPHVNWQ